MKALEAKQVKRRRRSIRKEVGEIDRMRRSFERKLESRLKRFFVSIFRDFSESFIKGERNFDDLRVVAFPLEQILYPHYREVIQAFGQRVLDRLEIKFDFDTIQGKYIQLFGGEKIVNISTYTMFQVNYAIKRGLDGGSTLPQIAKDIERLGSDFSRRRSAVIARTETHNASSYANHEMHKDFMPQNSTKQWVSTSDARTRSFHSAANGQVVNMDDNFIVNGKEMMYPGDPKGGPENVINCRCTVMYIASDDDVVDPIDPVDPVETDSPVPVPPKPVDPVDAIEAPVKRPKRKTDFTPRASTSITFKTGSEARKILRDKVKSNADDARHPTSTRFGGRETTDFGKTSEFDDDIAQALEPCLEDLDELADLFNIPRIRGFKALRGKRANADMGDGIMGINQENMRKRGEFQNPDKFHGGLETNSWLPDHKNWKENKAGRSWSSSAHIDSGFGRFRNTIFHEFGHHVHQMYKVDLDRWDKTIGRGWYSVYTPPIETRVKNMKRRFSPSVYGDSNFAEYFAENFAAYFNGRRDLCDPKFVKLIKELIDNAYD